MLKANRKRLRNGNQEESMLDVRIDIRTHPTLKLSKDMNCSSQCPRPAKRACVDLATDNARILQDLDPVHISAHGTTEVSKRPQTRGHIGQFRKRYNAFGTDVIEINATGDSSQEARRLQTRSSSFQLKSYHHPTAITPTREAIKVAEVPNVVNDNGGNSALKSALESLKALVDEQFECPICLDTCTDTHINPKCLHRFCGDCIKERLRKCNNECPSCRVHFPTKWTLRKDKRFDTIVSAPMSALNSCDLYLCSLCLPFVLQVQGVLGVIDTLEKQVQYDQHVETEAVSAVTVKSEESSNYSSAASARSMHNDINNDANRGICVSKMRVGDRKRTHEGAASSAQPALLDDSADYKLKSDTIRTGEVSSNDVVDGEDASASIGKDVANEIINTACESAKSIPTGDGPRCPPGNNVLCADRVAPLACDDTIPRLLLTPLSPQRGIMPNPTFNKHNEHINNTIFGLHLEDLKQFKIEHGHCDVPDTYKPNQPLGTWCRNLRYSYGLWRRSSGSGIKLTSERIELLKAVGFVFKHDSAGGKKKEVNADAHQNDYKLRSDTIGPRPVSYNDIADGEDASASIGKKVAAKEITNAADDKSAKSMNLIVLPGMTNCVLIDRSCRVNEFDRMISELGQCNQMISSMEKESTRVRALYSSKRCKKPGVS